MTSTRTARSDRDEYLRAITAYFEPGSNVSKAEIETVIDLYLGF